MKLFTARENGGGSYEVENPRLGRGMQEKIARAQKTADACVRKGRRGAAKHKKRLARLHQKLARQRQDHAHKLTTRITRRHPCLLLESLGTKDMTRSVREDGLAGWQEKMRTGLNRSVLDTAPATLYFMLRYKAEEAGSEFRELDGRVLRASQTCPACRAVRKKSLGERVHACPCGLVMGRDEASALLTLRVGTERGLHVGVPDPVTCARDKRGAAAKKRSAGKLRKAQSRLAETPATPERRAADREGSVETPTISVRI